MNFFLCLLLDKSIFCTRQKSWQERNNFMFVRKFEHSEWSSYNIHHRRMCCQSSCFHCMLLFAASSCLYSTYPTAFICQVFFLLSYFRLTNVGITAILPHEVPWKSSTKDIVGSKALWYKIVMFNFKTPILLLDIVFNNVDNIP